MLFLPSSRRAVFFFFLELARVVREYRAREPTTRARRMDVNFYTRFAVQPLILECDQIVVSPYISATEGAPRAVNLEISGDSN